MGELVDAIAEELAVADGSKPKPAAGAHSGTLVVDGVRCAEAASLAALFDTATSIVSPDQQGAFMTELAALLPGGHAGVPQDAPGLRRAMDVESAAATLAGFAGDGGGDRGVTYRPGAGGTGATSATGNGGGDAAAAALVAKRQRDDAGAGGSGVAATAPWALTVGAPLADASISPLTPLAASRPPVSSDGDLSALAPLLGPLIAEAKLQAAFLQAAASQKSCTAGRPRGRTAGGVAEPVAQLLAAAADAAASAVARGSELARTLVLAPATVGDGAGIAPSERRNGGVQLVGSLLGEFLRYPASSYLRELPDARKGPKVPRNNRTTAVDKQDAAVRAAAAALDATAAFTANAVARPATPSVGPAAVALVANRDALLAATLERVEAVNGVVARSQWQGAADALWWGIAAIA